MILICGDSLTELKKMESASVNCCVTSPPYWGLRDYGTAKWEGGSVDCDHKHPIDCGPNATVGNTTKGVQRPYKDVCGLCGATRQDNQLGLEKTPEEYVAKMVEVFREVKRILKDDGTLWLNLGDSYWANRSENGQSYDDNEVQRKRSGGKNHSNIKPKDLVGIPWMVAFALRADGWYLRQDIIWHKPNPMPESVTDRCTKAHEYIFLLSKQARYYFDGEAIKEKMNCPERYTHRLIAPDNQRKRNGTNKKLEAPRINLKTIEATRLKGLENPFRNKHSVWTVTTKPFKGAHFATFPEDLILPCILAGCPKDGVVLDCFAGAGTTGMVCKKNNRNFIGIELNPEYVKMAEQRINNTNGVLF